jgi:hypothetical protein
MVKERKLLKAKEDTLVLSEQEKQEKYTEMFYGIPDALFVLSGGVKKIAHPSGEPEYISTDYSDSDPYGMLAGKARVDAAAEVSHYLPTTKIVTTTHGPSLEQPGDATVIHAYVLTHELLQLGVPAERIIPEIKSTNTLTELQEMEKLIARHKWHHVGIITFELHAERTAVMLRHLAELSDLLDQELKESLEYVEREKARIVIVKAEDILAQISSHYKHLIEYARTTPSYQRRLSSERQGIEAIKKHAYRTTGETWKISSERVKIDH